MDLFEYQAKDLFAKHGVPVLPGRVAETPEQAFEEARRMAKLDLMAEFEAPKLTV